MLTGRTAELSELTALLDRAVQRRGGALVLRGDAGAGKSALLAEISAVARARGVRVHTTTGYQAEINIGYAGLHSLLLTMGVGGSSPPAGEVVLAVVGRGGQDDRPTGVMRAALGALTAVPEGEAALVVVDDAQWLDQPSWEALRSIGRHLDGEPVVVLLAVREGVEAARKLAGSELPELTVGPLAQQEAEELLDRSTPGLAAAARAQVLAVSAGNPLALVEFGRSAVGASPLSTRVERVFATLMSPLPESARLLLRVAAIDDRDDLAEILAAASMLAGRDLDLSDLRPAVAAALVDEPTAGRLRLRHPLLRAALRQSVTPAEALRIHAALARVISADPDRRAWHRAGATTGPDEQLASELAALADRAAGRGDHESAVQVLRRAAALSSDPADRAGRQLLAVLRLVALGSLTDGVRLLGQIDESRLRAPERARLAWLREESLGGGWSGAARLAAFAEAAEAVRADGDDELALEILHPLGARGYWANPDERTRAAVLAVLDRLAIPAGDPRLLTLVARMAPVDRGRAVLAELGRARASCAADSHRLGAAAVAVGALDLAAPLLAAAADGLRRQGNLGTLAQALMTQAWVAAQLGQVRLGLAAATECHRLFGEVGFPMWSVAALATRGQLEALRGHGEQALRLAEASEAVLLPAGAGPMLAMVALARGVNALAEGRPGDAWDVLSPVFDPAALPYHPYARFHALGLLADAAVASGHPDEAAAIVGELEPVVRQCPSPVLVRTLAYARAVLAPAGEAEALFVRGLAADLDAWPFERARLQLAYGAWLRRNRQPAASRELLRSASLTFDALGVAPWADRARRELAASGESLRRRPDRGDELTPQELQIAQLAAQGLSNREIAERLFVSPRTVSTHLYRIYPKLGVTTRIELARALEQ